MQPKLSIDLDELTFALTFHDPYLGSSYRFDLQTGAVIFVSDGVDAEDLPADLDDDARYLRIDAVDSSVSWQIRADFAEQVSDSRLARRLLDALEQRKPFRRFEDALAQSPEAREAWFAFERVALESEARAWCEASGITPVWTGYGARAIGSEGPDKA